MSDSAAGLTGGVSGDGPDMSGRAVLLNDAITITLPVAHLAAVVEGSWAMGALDTRWKITDAAAFARDLVNELNAEDEQGTTRIHRMLDGAIEEAIEQGAEGIEVHEIQDA